jgi:hypothetical protein
MRQGANLRSLLLADAVSDELLNPTGVIKYPQSPVAGASQVASGINNILEHRGQVQGGGNLEAEVAEQREEIP